MNYTQRTGYALVGAIALIGGYFFSRYMPPDRAATSAPPMSETAAATVIPQPRELRDFALEDHTGGRFSTASLRDRWTLLVFGYTHCPDVCPTALLMLSQVDKQLQADRVDARYQIAFVSVDPERDTRERLAEYIPYFNPGFIGVRGEHEALQKLTSQLGVIYAKVSSGREAGDYLMDHSASIILIDPQGRYRAVFSAPHDAAAIAADFERISSH